MESREGLRYNSMVQYFSSMHKALGLILKIAPKKELSQQRKEIQIERVRYFKAQKPRVCLGMGTRVTES